MLNINLANDMRIIVFVVIILVAAFVVVRLLQLIINRAIRKESRSSDFDPTALLFAKRFISLAIYLLGVGAALTQVPEFKIIGHSLIAGAGVLTLVTGLASQQVLSNIVSGILIVVFRPFRLNDRITINGMTGVVEDINLRQIVLRDLENNRIVIPNSVVSSNALVNFNHTDDRCCKTLEIGIGYRADIDRAMAIIVEEALRHPLLIDGRKPEQVASNTPEVLVRLVNLGESSVDLKAWVWAKDASDGFILICDLYKSIKQRFDAEGIEIPFPQRTISYAKEAQAAQAGSVGR
jgi:small conductance mechanosensitive channel